MSVVKGIKAILGIKESNAFSWTAPEARGATVVITYSYTSKFNDTQFWPAGSRLDRFDKAQRLNTEKVLDVFEEATGIVFKQVKGNAMMNFAASRSLDDGVAGQALLPYRTDFFTGNTTVEVEQGGSYAPGTFGYYVLLHEIGHALGLVHPHEGPFTLANRLDNPRETVMTYNDGAGLNRRDVTELGRLDKKALKVLYGDSADASNWKITKSGGTITIRADGKANEIVGTSNKNKVFGKGGKDKLFGREKDDQLFGGRGADTLDGGVGSNTLFGGKGKDKLIAKGDDDLFGGGGGDLLRNKDSGAAVFYGGNGVDKFKGGGAFTSSEVFGGRGLDLLNSKDGSDTLHGDGGADVINGRGGQDHLFGGNGDDVIYGGNDRDTMFGGDGDDVIRGGNGDDEIEGGAGDDVLIGNAGDDRITGGDGLDVLEGNDGNDLLFGGDGDDVIRGGDGNDRMFGGEGYNVLEGGAGSDKFEGGSGQNEWTGGQGADVFVFAQGQTLIQDFETLEDQLLIDVDLLDLEGGETTDAFLDKVATIESDRILLTLENGDQLDIKGITDLQALKDSTDLSFF